ncbi:protein LSM14 homolog car-1 isoform X2 [Bombus pascuorum]|uniref:protein LSM14 homolog car-1 isoform X2 n=1 Tax=Bombus pascuorum TaxID=65598 RepID=UPI00298E8CC4|nr:protein LSM14 homolog car-1 isoform X2 [Bombus pascuorum]
MSGGMPELGSKISLISKADIRYEGRLFTVDPQECTIALANVRSFGTEDRETQLPVAPQNQVYEYILFRGSDIKDIRVVNNVSSIPNDPAIVQMTVQPSMSQQSYQPQPSYAHPMMGPMGGQYGTPYGMTMGTMGPVMGMPTSARDPRGPINKQPSVLDLISGGSRSTTPTSSLLTRKSPTMDQGIQVGHQQQQQQQQQSGNVGKLGEKTNMRTIQPARRDHDSHSGNKAGGTVSQYNEGKRDTMKQDGQLQGQGSHNQGGRGNRGGWMNRGNMRGRGRGRGGFRNQPGNTGAKPKNTLKFDNDYDFEQANTEFEELRSQLAKTKIDAGADNEKKDDSGNETGAGEGEPEEEPEIVHYDKSKSFFDNISCEAVERSKGRFQRTDWRTERKLNSETFGVASTRRGGFRGRGYYNRGMGGMYRGGGGAGGSGFRGGYRGSRGGNRKPGNQQQQNNPGSQNRTTNEQSTTQSQQNSRVVSF